ncbi:hypothetical protein EXS73_02425 [Candidatus Pacearchaeota archaeon]|nr:hypothetical protein [Candidatus Pacearchaeota archaeon]
MSSSSLLKHPLLSRDSRDCAAPFIRDVINVAVDTSARMSTNNLIYLNLLAQPSSALLEHNARHLIGAFNILYPELALNFDQHYRVASHSHPTLKGSRPPLPQSVGGYLRFAKEDIEKVAFKTAFPFKYRLSLEPTFSFDLIGKELSHVSVS